MSQKVVITGMGMVSSLGWSVRENWSAVIEKRTGIGKLLLFESPRCGNLPVAQIKHYPSDMAEKIPSDMPRTTVFGCCAADEALQNAGLKPGTSILKDASIVIGCCTGGMLETENFMERHYSKSLSEIDKEISISRTFSRAMTSFFLVRFTGARIVLPTASAIIVAISFFLFTILYKLHTRLYF